MTQRPVKGRRRVTRPGPGLTAIALTIFMVEAQIPVAVPIPGIKLGLANIVTVYTVFAWGRETLCWCWYAGCFWARCFPGR